MNAPPSWDGASRAQPHRLLGKDRLEAFVPDAVEPGATVRTDGLRAYGGLPDLGYDHLPINVSRTGAPASASMPHVHRVLSLLKPWLLGTHQGSVKPQQLDYYLDEFAFRPTGVWSRSQRTSLHGRARLTSPRRLR